MTQHDIFWILCSLLRLYLLVPIRRLLQSSNLLRTKACSSIFVVSISIRCLILAIFLMVMKSVLVNLFICAVDFSSFSIIYPKSHTESTHVIKSFPICTDVFVVLALSRLFLLPTMINSVLLSLRFKRFVLIQSLML